ncbi:MAG: phosphate acyltransferase PlsX [Mariprofundales bacterium]
MRILLDGHGGDGAPGVVIDALDRARANYGSQVMLGVVGQQQVLEPLLAAARLRDVVELIHADEVIGMCDAPGKVVRGKRHSSMHVGASLVKEGAWDAWVSSGNTGALMAISKLMLRTIPGVDRPAIASLIPSMKHASLFLDIGANVDCSSKHLYQFAQMGACYMEAAEGIAAPRVGLLNIGSEAIKGTEVVKEAALLLAADARLNYVGNVEATDIFEDVADVVVCDGFVGNVALKSMEGTARLILNHLKQELSSAPVARIGAMLAGKALRRTKAALSPSEHNGAPLLGLNGVVVKSHGSADGHALACAIEVARREVEAGLLERISRAVEVD